MRLSVRLLRQAGSGWAFYNGGNRWTFGDVPVQSREGIRHEVPPELALERRGGRSVLCPGLPGRRLRLVQRSARTGELIPSLHFEREIREGVDDYRYLLTLSRLADRNRDAAAAALIRSRMEAFRLGQRDHDALFPAADWQNFRRQLAEAIERLRRGVEVASNLDTLRTAARILTFT